MITVAVAGMSVSTLISPDSAPAPHQPTTASFTVTETQPRGFAVSPDGRYLICAGERSTSIALYRVHGDELELVKRAETGHKANWVWVMAR